MRRVLRAFSENKSKSLEELRALIPNDNQDLQLPKQKPVISGVFGLSDVEDTEPFFLENTRQFVYTPSKKLVFVDDFALIYSSSARIWHFEKLWVCRKVIGFYGLAGLVAAQPFIYSVPTIVIACLFPQLVLARGLLIDHIWLHKGGDKLKLKYRRFKFGSSKIVEVPLANMIEPSGDKFGLWNLYEFPDDLKTYCELDDLKKWSYSKKIKGWWSFMILKGNPLEVDREVLVNALNGVRIDTEAVNEGVFETRYRPVDKDS